jgi:hypothetical protein
MGESGVNCFMDVISLGKWLGIDTQLLRRSKAVGSVLAYFWKLYIITTLLCRVSYIIFGVMVPENNDV